MNAVDPVRLLDVAGHHLQPRQTQQRHERVVFHTSTINTAHIAVSVLAVHAIFWSTAPTRSSTSLMMTYWSFSIHAHILVDTMVGIDQGIRMAARTSPRPLNSAFRTSATTRPETVSMVTETTENRTVFQAAFHHAGSTNVPR